MTKAHLTPRVASMRRLFTRNLLAVLALGMLFTACKKDDDDKPDNPGKTEEGYFPTSTTKTYKYRSDDDGDISEHNLRVTGTKDSAGGKVYNYQVSFDDGSKINPFVHYTNSLTVYANTLPSDMQEYLDMIKEDPDVSDFTITGFPLLQKLPSNPKVGDVVNFSEPMHIGFKALDDEGEEFEMSMDFGLNEGTVLGFEDVTTAAGTFKNCVKWQYKNTMTTRIGSLPPTVNSFTSVQWYAKGVGLVKSTEVGGNTSSTTTLMAIQ